MTPRTGFRPRARMSKRIREVNRSHAVVVVVVVAVAVVVFVLSVDDVGVVVVVVVVVGVVAFVVYCRRVVYLFGCLLLLWFCLLPLFLQRFLDMTSLHEANGHTTTCVAARAGTNMSTWFCLFVELQSGCLLGTAHTKRDE